ncbi:MAG: hypothetical protein IT360_25430 [Gemmatimonadaceae bacterium]|nr:hypothetical protein [Gemmatimonadaceae bacterium]
MQTSTLRALATVLAVWASGGCDSGPSRQPAGSAADTPSASVTDSLADAPAGSGETAQGSQSSPDALGAFRLAGNEPFWGVRIDAGGLSYTTPDYPGGIHFPSSAPTVQGTTLRWVAITAPPDAHTLDVTLEAHACQDSMADKTWTHTARVTFDGTALSGCGERASPAPR